MPELVFESRSESFAEELRAKLPELLPGLNARALALCKRKSEAQDLVQDTLLRALCFESGYERETNLRGWLQQILFSVFITRCRRSARERRALSALACDPCAWTQPEAPPAVRQCRHSLSRTACFPVSSSFDSPAACRHGVPSP